MIRFLFLLLISLNFIIASSNKRYGAGLDIGSKGSGIFFNYLSGNIDGHEVEIFGHIKSQPRPCLKCQKMIEHGRAIHCERRWLPCRWSN